MLPILSRRSIFLLCLSLAGPLGGLVFEWPPTVVAALAAFPLAVLVLRFVVERFRAKQFRNRLFLEGQLPATLAATRGSALVLKVTCPSLGRPYSFSLRPAPPPGIVAAEDAHTCRVPSSGGTCPVKHAFIPYQRGNLEFSVFWVRAPLGFFTWQFPVRLTPPVAADVFPNSRLPSEAARKALDARHAGSLQLLRPYSAEGREFESLRTYTPHDDLRRVDWKRSAKRANLTVKTYRPETHQRLFVALDLSRRMSGLVDDRTQLEYALDAAAHLVHLAIAGDDEIGLLAFHRRTVVEIGAARGKRHQARLLGALRDLELDPLDADFGVLKDWALSLRKRALIVTFTSASMPMNMDSVRAALVPASRKHICVVSAVRNRELDSLLAAPASSLDSAFVNAAAYEARTAMEQRMEMLQRSGIDCMYHDAMDLSTAIHRKYFDLKAYGRW